VHVVPLVWKASRGQDGLTPSQLSATSHSPLAGRQIVPALLVGCRQAPLPSQASDVQALPSSVQLVPAGWKSSAGQDELIPSQLSAASHSPLAARQTVPAWPAGCRHDPLPLQASAVQTFPSSVQLVPAGRNPSAGQLGLTPSQVSAGSHSPLAVRQTVPALPAGCEQLPLPLHVSVVHTLPSSVHAVPFDLNPSAGQLVLVPEQLSARSHSPDAARQTVPALPAGCEQLPLPSHASVVQTLPSSEQLVPDGWNPSAGQVPLAPVHASAASHSPAALRHCVPAVTKPQAAVQHDPAAPFEAPRSQASPRSTVPSPQNGARNVAMAAAQDLEGASVPVAE
jgi:hypothetical protein